MKHISNGPSAILPNKTTIKPSHTGQLPFHTHLSTKATTSLVYPELTNESLLSIGKLCDDNCIAIFDKHHLHITKNNRIILKGHRNLKDGLWDVSLPPRQLKSNTSATSLNNTSRPTINYIIQKDKKNTI